MRRERAQFFHGMFEPLNRDFSDLQSLTLHELEELLEKTQVC